MMVEFQTKTLEEFEKVKDLVSNRFSSLIEEEKTVQLVLKVLVLIKIQTRVLIILQTNPYLAQLKIINIYF